MKVKLFLAKKSTTIMLLSFCIFVIIWVVEDLHIKQNRYLKNQVNSKSKAELATVRATLESFIYSDIYYANSLSTLLTVNPHSTIKQWDLIAAELYRDSLNIRHLAIAPDDIVKYVYPLKGNVKALGLDFRSIQNQWLTVQKARHLETIFIAGPVDLIQGGSAFVARMPVFTDPPYNQDYWGSISIVLDIDGLFYESGIFDLKTKYHFAMRGRDSKGAEGDVFFGNPKIFGNPIITETVTLPYGSWQMAIKEKKLSEVNPWYQINIIRLVGYTFSILMLLSITIIFRLYVIATNRSLEDELTQLPNRRYFMYTLNSLFSKSKRKKTPFALLNLDLEKFKNINDMHGHAAGDEVLREVARRVSKALRSNDVVARIGGDEYLVLLPRIHEKKDIYFIINKIKLAISDEPITYKDTFIYVKVTIGYSCFDPEMGSVDDLLHKADRSMYFNKRH
ncbi:diguanylate cyclase [Aliivibrio sp. S4TY2]|uniref:diguanylate cyclase n=1 Tax=unclassified Aliivibrio TaxID=2645654 RepID=UPI002378AE70|nr:MULTISPECIES: diguanylate cyclase [unclassified Aliivibrio]MDD9156849.1 diguanylate cyclase [Aliivibrio sp. S4TY2]MDD9160335.1 diguanylate cyclase [Aliivibrio sp. S4TY1]MDD9164372.1 diguanylate cyclase [Aliivibrio sp. S4MY2]MDD9168758.1 diguanylate cyclase [Aliivibrio sp. S4MY4]MDD9184707.1 diguanylate cyclase [Aliivibrio sp. S4MY3]